MTYPIVSVPENAQEQLEQLGTKQKFWFVDPSEQLCLFKYAREGTGEDWAEKIAAELGAQLGLPHAKYDLAECGGRRGVVTPSFSPVGGRLIFGNELLSYAVSGYETQPRHHRQHHTIGRVFALLSSPNIDIQVPLEWTRPEQLSSAGSVFLGYLLLDVLIGNQDRHDENWGVLLHQGKVYLQPTFDHASSLGRNESDEVRANRLQTTDQNRSVERYVARARSALYAAPTASKPLSTLEAFVSGAKHEPSAAKFWLERLSRLEDDGFRQAIWNVDSLRMSEVSKQFALRMCQLNKQRLLGAVV